MKMITIIPERIERENPFITARPKTFSPKRQAIDALTILFDITAMRIVEDASTIGRSHSADFSDIS